MELTDSVVIGRSPFSGFYLSADVLRRLGFDDEDDVPRNSLAIVTIVREMGKAAVDKDASLEIVKLPPGKYVIVIDAYFNVERVCEYHRVFCEGEWQEAGIVVTIPKGE